MNDSERELLKLLAASHGNQYQTDPQFKVGMDSLVRFLPLFVETFAKQCEEQQSELNARVQKEMLRKEPRPWLGELKDEQ